MIIKIAIVLLSLANGAWMLLDGTHVLLKGKYIGPEKPGPWSSLVTALGIDPFKIGPLFLTLGIFWILFAVAQASGQGFAWWMGFLVAVATLWYIPVGTIVSIIVLSLLILIKMRGV